MGSLRSWIWRNANVSGRAAVARARALVRLHLRGLFQALKPQTAPHPPDPAQRPLLLTIWADIAFVRNFSYFTYPAIWHSFLPPRLVGMRSVPRANACLFVYFCALRAELRMASSVAFRALFDAREASAQCFKLILYFTSHHIICQCLLARSSHFLCNDTTFLCYLRIRHGIIMSN